MGNKKEGRSEEGDTFKVLVRLKFLLTSLPFVVFTPFSIFLTSFRFSLQEVQMFNLIMKPFKRRKISLPSFGLK